MTELDRSAFGTGYDQANGILSNYNNRKAALQAGDAYSQGNVAGAAGILAKSGQIDQARTLNADAASKAAAAKAAQQEQASHAVNAMVNMAQGLKQVPADKRAEAFQKVIAPLLQQQGVDPAHIQQMGQSDFSDQTLDMTISALGKEATKYQTVSPGATLYNPDTHKAEYTAPAAEKPAQWEFKSGVREDGTPYQVWVNPQTQEVKPATGGNPNTTAAPTPQDQMPNPSGGSIAQRNNNPGNLRPDGSKWQGMVGENGGFVQFDTPENGLRAARINLANQQRLHGIDTLSGLITKYAPASDKNDPQAYIATIAKQTGIDPNAKIDLSDRAIQDKILPAMFAVESGGTPSPQAGTQVQGAVTGDTSNDPFTSHLTPDKQLLVDKMADQFALGAPAPNGRDKQSTYLWRQAQIAAYKKYGNDLNPVAMQANLKANQQVLNQASKDRERIIANIQPAEAAADLALSHAQAANLTGQVPAFNGPWREVKKKWLGDPQLSAIAEDIGTYNNEFNKVAAGSKGTITDKSRDGINERFNNAQTLQQMEAVIADSKVLMEQVKQAQTKQVDDRIFAIAHGLTPSSEGPNQSAPQGQSGSVNGYTPEQVAAHQVLKKQDPSWNNAFNRIPRTQAEYDKIKPGEHYLDTDGAVKVKQ